MRTAGQKGFTLIELVMVIVILGVLSGIAMQSLQSSVNQSRFDETATEMDKLARAIAGDERLVSNGYRSDFGYIGDIGSLPASLEALVSNPGYSTWNGPYIKDNFVENTDDYKMDAWNEPYLFSGGTTIASNGGGQTITKRFANSTGELTANTVKGIVRDQGLSPPGDSAMNVSITIVYPDGSGGWTSLSTVPNAAGEFGFTNRVPIGIHQAKAVAGSDTASKFIVIYPGKTTHSELRFSNRKW